MAEELPNPNTTPATATSESPAKDKKEGDFIIIRMWPKTPVLYPMALIALVCGIVAHFSGSTLLSSFPEKPTTVEVQAADGIEGAPAVGEEAPADADAPPGVGEGAATVQSLDLLAAQAAGAPDAPAAATTAEEEFAKKRLDRSLAVIFLVAMFFSLFAICVDMDVRWALIYSSGIVIAVLILWIVDMSVGGVFDKIFGVLDGITPMANAMFYFGVFFVWLLMMIISFVITRFHYVRIEPNEVIVVGGMLERQQRHSTMRMRYTKEVHDVMEYYLPFVRSGRLIFSFPEQSEAVIIDNVLGIAKVTRKVDKMVSALQIVSD